MSDKQVGQIPDIKVPTKLRKPGRPRAISEELEPVVTGLYQRGYGYRAIARILREEYRINPDFTTVRRALRKLGILPPASK